MIIGVGIDLVSIERLAESLKSEAFKRRVFSPAEMAQCEGVANSAEKYAGKFAAKEAMMKAIGKGIRQSVWFTQIELLNQESGAPVIAASGEARKTLAALGADQVHVSISHTGETAVAVVILERDEG